MRSRSLRSRMVNPRIFIAVLALLIVVALIIIVAVTRFSPEATNFLGNDLNNAHALAKKGVETPLSYSRYYTFVNTHEKPPSWSSYDNYNLNCLAATKLKHYALGRKLGSGTYGKAYVATDTRDNTTVVVKKLKNIRIKRIKKEVQIMSQLCGQPNIIPLHEVTCVPGHEEDQTAFVMEYVENEQYKKMYPKFSDYELRYYLYLMIRALDTAHANGIIHRDVKPLNVVIDRPKRKLRVIDWGLAEYYVPDTAMSLHVATRMYKSAEILLENKKYDYAMDVWAIGVILAGSMFNKHPFVYGKNDVDQLYQVATVVGTEALREYVKKYSLKPGELVMNVINLDLPRTPWSSFVGGDTAHYASPEAFDLLDKLLDVDHRTRISCAEALQHPYFAEVREEVRDDKNPHNSPPGQCFNGFPKPNPKLQPPNEGSDFTKAFDFSSDDRPKPNTRVGRPARRKAREVKKK